MKQSDSWFYKKRFLFEFYPKVMSVISSFGKVTLNIPTPVSQLLSRNVSISVYCRLSRFDMVVGLLQPLVHNQR